MPTSHVSRAGLDCGWFRAGTDQAELWLGWSQASVFRSMHTSNSACFTVIISLYATHRALISALISWTTLLFEQDTAVPPLTSQLLHQQSMMSTDLPRQLESACWVFFSALTMLVGQQEGHPGCKHQLSQRFTYVSSHIVLPTVQATLVSSPWSECTSCHQRGHEGSRTLLNWKCQLRQVVLYNGCKMVVVPRNNYFFHMHLCYMTDMLSRWTVSV